MEAADASSGDRRRTLLNLPPGYHFAPTDEELIVHYLRPKIENLGQLLPIFKDVDVVSRRPEQITADYKECGEERWFFFTKRHRKYNRGNRPNRMTPGNGYWKATGPQRMIYAGKELVGRVRTLVFYDGATKGMNKEKALPEGKTSWTMYEYENLKSEEEAANQSADKLAEWVLCTIQEQKKKEPGKEDSGAGEKKVNKETTKEGVPAGEKKVKETTKVEGEIKAGSNKRKGKQEKIDDEDPIQALHLMKRRKVPVPPPHPQTFAPEEGYEMVGMFVDNSFPKKSLSPVPPVQQQQESPHSETMSPCVTDNNYYGPTMAPAPPCLHEPPHSETTPTSAGGNYNTGSAGSNMIAWQGSPFSEMMVPASTRFAGNTNSFDPSMLPTQLPQEAPHMRRMEYETSSFLGHSYHNIAPNMMTHQPATSYLYPYSASAQLGGYSYGYGDGEFVAMLMNSGELSSQNLGGYFAGYPQYHGEPSVVGHGRAVGPAAALPLQDQVTART